MGLRHAGLGPRCLTSHLAVVLVLDLLSDASPPAEEPSGLFVDCLKVVV